MEIYEMETRTREWREERRCAEDVSSTVRERLWEFFHFPAGTQECAGVAEKGGMVWMRGRGRERHFSLHRGGLREVLNMSTVWEGWLSLRERQP